MNWWLSSNNSNYCYENTHLKTSTYLICLLILTILFTKFTVEFSLLSKVLFILGTILTFKDWCNQKCTLVMVIVSVIFHYIPVAVYMYKTTTKLRFKNICFSLGILLPILFIYKFFPILWPYSMSPATIFAGVITILLTDF